MTTQHTFADGKYTVINDNGKLTALRHGEPWDRDLTGDNLVYWMLVEVDRLKAALEVNEDMVVRAARELCRIHAGECQIDEQDTWNVYSDQFKQDARAALYAAHGIKGEA